MSVAARQYTLLSIVLCDRCVALVDSDERVGAQLNLVIIERDLSDELAALARPHMDTGRQKHRLPIVNCIADEALLNDADGAVAVPDVDTAHSIACKWHRVADRLNKHGVDVVHARLSKQIVILVVHQEADVACLDEELKVQEFVQWRTNAKVVAVFHALPHVLLLCGVGPQVVASEDVIDRSPAELGAEQARLLKWRIRRRVFVVDVILRCGTCVAAVHHILLMLNESARVTTRACSE
mmetsp:Transcript_8851/g.17991  ORF Transcript_8851/g.17991 Transcript_8851/m.17991 type:complete len:239 (-) Transcript_8851:31-747(-)